MLDEVKSGVRSKHGISSQAASGGAGGEGGEGGGEALNLAGHEKMPKKIRSEPSSLLDACTRLRLRVKKVQTFEKRIAHFPGRELRI